MDNKKHRTILLVITMLLVLIPVIVFALGEEPGEVIKSITGNNQEEEKVSEQPQLLETEPVPVAPEVEEGYTYVGYLKVGDDYVFYEAMFPEEYYGNIYFALVGNKLTLQAPTTSDISIKKNLYDDSEYTGWIEIDANEPILEKIMYKWGSDDKEGQPSTYTYDSVKEEDISNPIHIKIQFKTDQVYDFVSDMEYMLMHGCVLQTKGDSFVIKEDQSAINVKSGEIQCATEDLFTPSIPLTLSRKISVNNIVKEAFSILIITDDREKKIDDEFINQHITFDIYRKASQGSDDTLLQKDCKTYNLKNVSGEKLYLKIKIDGIFCGYTKISIADKVDLKNAIEYPKFGEIGTTVTLRCNIEDDLKFDTVSYEWHKVPDTDILSETSTAQTKALGESNIYSCKVKAYVKATDTWYEPEVEEVSITAGNVTDKSETPIGETMAADGTLIPTSVSGGGSGDDSAADKYLFIPQQTGNYFFNVDAECSVITADGSPLSSVGNNNYELKARNRYYVYVMNANSYSLKIENKVLCDHSCGTDLKGATETYSGDKYCKNCELLIEKGHEIKKEDKKKKEQESSSTSSGSTGDNNDLLLFIVLVIVSALDIAGFACFKKNKK